VYVADSFEGLPSAEQKYPADKVFAHLHTIKYLAVSQEEVENNFRRYDLLDNDVIFIKGFFEHSLINTNIDKLAILRLDGDMYSSTIQVLDALYDKVSDGGYIIIDDYFLTPCQHAVHDFRARRHITSEMKIIDNSSRYWKKESSKN